jgi:hypothetical protein
MDRRSSRTHQMLTLAQKTLVQETFAAVAPLADDVAALFYRRLSVAIN